MNPTVLIESARIRRHALGGELKNSYRDINNRISCVVSRCIKT